MGLPRATECATTSLDGNNKLCGGIAKFHLAPCPKISPRKHKLHYLSSNGKLIISIVGGLFRVYLISFFLTICCFKKQKKQQSSESLWKEYPFLNISYGELLKSTDGFSDENLIGVGGFGSVYKGTLERDQ